MVDLVSLQSHFLQHLFYVFSYGFKLKSHVPSKYFGHPTFPVVPEPRSQICQLYGLASSNRVDPQGQVPFGGNYAPPILDLLDLRDNKILLNPGLSLYDYRFDDPKG